MRKLATFLVMGFLISACSERAGLEVLCKLGSAEACYSLGVMYSEGKGVPQDYKKAVEFYEKACNKNMGEACLNLGVMYARGQGVLNYPPLCLSLLHASKQAFCMRYHFSDHMPFDKTPPP